MSEAAHEELKQVVAGVGSAEDNVAKDDVLDDDVEPTGVSGTLREMPVPEIVQMLAQASKDALVEVKPRGAARGVIGFEHGRVTHCATAALSGEAAFFALFSASRGTFRIRYGRHAETVNIARDTTFLLLEAARVLDEGNEAHLDDATNDAIDLAFPECLPLIADAPPSYEGEAIGAVLAPPAAVFARAVPAPIEALAAPPPPRLVSFLPTCFASLKLDNMAFDDLNDQNDLDDGRDTDRLHREPG